MRQYAPWPHELVKLIESMRWSVMPAWRFYVRDQVRDPANTHGGEAGGLTFVVLAETRDAYAEVPRSVYHYFPVPAATYDRQSWQLWIKKCLAKIMNHELDEGILFGDERPFAPNHGPGRDPYSTFVYSTDAHRRTSFKGEVKSS